MDMSTQVRAWIFPFFFLLFPGLPCASAQSQDDQPHIQPRNAPAPKPKPSPQTKTQEPAPGQSSQPESQEQPQVPATEPTAQESSSKDSQADFSAAPLSRQPGPTPLGKGA